MGGRGGGAKCSQIKSQSKHLLMLVMIILLFAGNKEIKSVTRRETYSLCCLTTCYSGACVAWS